MSAKTNQIISDKPSEKFRKAMRHILSVPKAELERREAEYQKERKAKSSKGHR
jgi:hypothetical protein